MFLAPLNPLCQYLCSFFGFYDANETVLEMEQQPVSSMGRLPFSLHCSPSFWSFVCLCLVGEGEGRSGHQPYLIVCFSSMSPWPSTYLKVYLRDSFGLKTLLARGAIVRCQMAGISHTAWHSNRTLYDTCIEPWLS